MKKKITKKELEKAFSIIDADWQKIIDYARKEKKK